MEHRIIHRQQFCIVYTLLHLIQIISQLLFVLRRCAGSRYPGSLLFDQGTELEDIAEIRSLNQHMVRHTGSDDIAGIDDSAPLAARNQAAGGQRLIGLAQGAASHVQIFTQFHLVRKGIAFRQFSGQNQRLELFREPFDNGTRAVLHEVA
jgi:hypothetical protein